jgi:hypothetical protein
MIGGAFDLFATDSATPVFGGVEEVEQANGLGLAATFEKDPG